MKKCKYCQTEIDSKAKICPNCRKKQGKSKLPIILFLLLIGIIALASGGNSQSNSSNNNTNETNNSTVEQQEKFSYTVTDEYNDYWSHYIEGIVTNNRDKDYSYVQIEFVCYDTEGNNIGTAIDNTNNLLGGQTWKYKAMGLFTDQQVDHCDFHEVTGW